MDPKLEQYSTKFAGLEDSEPSTLQAAVVRCVTRLKRSNLAIVAIVLIAALNAYKGLSIPIALAAFGAITVLGVFGGSRES